ncbi:hypothetical protein [Kitasatospora sp. GP82]|uniref:hypothetical protein n=1 Tax=Kitasatospora sp. GP82 TaxID=3035089 RepID=UPI002475AEDA|nr:hypothetical protein [Kitasatospora sp. GP82]MDH6125432.1 hypothetical protein [Kitasatospora sp. GP82]
MSNRVHRGPAAAAGAPRPRQPTTDRSRLAEAEAEALNAPNACSSWNGKWFPAERPGPEAPATWTVPRSNEPSRVLAVAAGFRPVREDIAYWAGPAA